MSDVLCIYYSFSGNTRRAMKEIADEVGAKFWVDMAHFAGLIAAGLHPSPVPYADVVSSTAHKTLGGPRSGFILAKQEYAKKLNSAVFPGQQGGPLMHVIAGKAVAFGEALRHAAFQVGSIITTTGFSSCDFDLWPTLAKEVLVLLMFVGACAGSTGGGIKVSRFLLMGKTLGKELKQALHPQVVAPVRMDGKLVNHETIRTTNVFLAAYIFIFAASFMLVSLDGFDMVTNFTSIAATLNNIGPGLNQVGPMMNFGAYSNFAKLVLIFDMLAGRLEIFPMLVLFLPDAWRRF